MIFAVTLAFLFCIVNSSESRVDYTQKGDDWGDEPHNDLCKEGEE